MPLVQVRGVLVQGSGTVVRLGGAAVCLGGAAVYLGGALLPVCIVCHVTLRGAMPRPRFSRRETVRPRAVAYNRRRKGVWGQATRAGTSVSASFRFARGRVQVEGLM